MIQYFDISKWSKLPHINTGGTRNKFITISPEGKKYYFKTSLKRENRDYKYEFWSEIIAYCIGKNLGFDVVRYDIASFESNIGCLSESIINVEKEEHHEGYRYIIQKYPDFTKNYKKAHSFQYIISSLDNIGLGHFKKDVIKMIIFDAVIGNTDRHSENWALILKKDSKNSEHYDPIKRSYKEKGLYRIPYFIYTLFRTGQTITQVKKKQGKKNFRFSPLYDNGSSLGRELKGKKIASLLGNREQMNRYIKRGYSDIRWHDQKLSLIELVRAIRSHHMNIVDSTLSQIESRYCRKSIENILSNIDNNVPPLFAHLKLPYERKLFIIEYIDLRVKKILELLHETTD